MTKNRNFRLNVLHLKLTLSEKIYKCNLNLYSLDTIYLQCGVDYLYHSRTTWKYSDGIIHRTTLIHNELSCANDSRIPL